MEALSECKPPAEWRQKRRQSQILRKTLSYFPASLNWQSSPLSATLPFLCTLNIKHLIMSLWWYSLTTSDGTVQTVRWVMYTHAVVFPAITQTTPLGRWVLPWHITCSVCNSLHCIMGRRDILRLWNTGETASADVMCIQLRSATENDLNYLIPNKAWVSAVDKSSFR